MTASASTSDLLRSALDAIASSRLAFVKFLSANDTGLTGGHQCGIYIPKPSVKLIFDGLFERGANHDRWADITWNDGKTTRSRFVYYGQGTRDEYRITHFGRGFSFLKPEHTGDLLAICKQGEEKYRAYVLSPEDSAALLDALSLSPTETNALVKCEDSVGGETRVSEVIENFLAPFGDDFPTTRTMALTAEKAERVLRGETVEQSLSETLVRWIDLEYKMFRRIEEVHYAYVTLEPAASLDEYVKTGLEIANRRKSRAGKSLEHHLAALFREMHLMFSAQAVTEGNKMPDFIFPSIEAYHDESFPSEGLTFLGAKTTCKDRWRQVLNEANRIPRKYLFTLQQGMSPNQLDEMEAEGLTLVVPQPYLKTYPKRDSPVVVSLEEFVRMALEKQGHYVSDT